MRIPSTEQAFKSLVDRLPRSLGDLLWNITYLIAWVTLPVSFLSAISDLHIVLGWANWLYERAADLRPLLDQIVSVLRVVVDAWRDLTAPVRTWLADLLPDLHIPPGVVDVALAFLICVPSLLRHYLAIWSEEQGSGKRIEQDIELAGQLRGRPREEFHQAMDAATQNAARRRAWGKMDRARLLLTYAAGSALVAGILIVIDRFYR